jgi:hypothetical protein
VLASLAAIFAGRFLIRPALLPLARRFGLKRLVIGGVLLTAVQYPLLAQVHGVGWVLLALCLVASAGDTLYWTTYHAYFAALGDPEHRGHQIGAREASAAVVAIAGPLAAGWALTVLGPRIAFGATAVVLLCAALPLLRTPDVAVADSAPGAFHASLLGARFYLMDGWIEAGLYYVWQIGLFLTLKENFAAYGGAMALATLVGAVSSLVLGRGIDRGHGGRAVWLSLGAIALAIGLRSAGLGHPILAVAANGAGAIALALYTPTLMTAVYNSARLAPCALRFQMAAEGGFDAGAAAGCLTAALLLHARVSLSADLLLPLLGVFGMLAMLRRHYGTIAPAAL